MRYSLASYQTLNRDSGFTLLEVLVSLTLSALILGSATLFFMDTAKQAHDQEIMAATREELMTVLDLITFELRLAGAGMPLTQEGFIPGMKELGDAPLPVLSDSTDSRISFRYSEQGATVTLTSDWTPAPNNREFAVDHTEGIEVGMTVYLSNLTRGQTDALTAVVSDVSKNTIKVSNGYAAVKGVNFPAGSILHPVQTIAYQSTPSGQGILRTRDGETLTMSVNSSLVLDYFDWSGNLLALPLSTAEIWNDLAAVRLTVHTQSSKLLRNGKPYETEVEQLVVLRNL